MEVTTSGVSQQNASEMYEPKSCGFDDCEEYVIRCCSIYCASGNWTIPWRPGDPEDKIVGAIDKLELQMKIVKEYCSSGAWMALHKEYLGYLDELCEMLESRFEKHGKTRLSLFVEKTYN